MSNLENLLNSLEQAYPNQAEFLQAVAEVGQHIVPIYNANQSHKQHDVLMRLCRPQRVIEFNIEWQSDSGKIETNLGWRVQHSNLLGPYKGGLRFHPATNLSVLRFLAFEQTFKNALTGMQIGGAKGGSDFDPRGRSDDEIRRFCTAYMAELSRYIGSRTDIPAGDINVGNREIGYLYGAYKRMTLESEGVMTGKPINIGGSFCRIEATGYGIIYFLIQVLKQSESSIEGMKVCISGAGNVALHTAQQAIKQGAIVKTLSNSKGYLKMDAGFELQDIDYLLSQVNDENPLLSLGRNKTGAYYLKHRKPWEVEADIAIPCATQNELLLDDAKTLINKGYKILIEGANMPCTTDAQKHLHKHDFILVPGKASNAGGVVMSALEMSQNAGMELVSGKKLNQQLKERMALIHQKCVDEGREENRINYTKGANVSAYRVLAEAMMMQGY